MPKVFSINVEKIGRMPFFDFLKMFAMFMVLWGHCIQHLQTGEVWNEPMHKFIYTFHLPLFMMIAGFFSLSSLRLNFKQLLIKKGCQLLLPCITWGFILYIVIAIMNLCMGAFLSYSPFFVFFQHFWFLKCLFLCYLIAFVGGKLTKNIWIWGLLTLGVAHTSTTHQLPIMYFSFLIGILLRYNFDKFKAHYKSVTIISSLIFLLILVISHGDLPLKGVNYIDIISTCSITPPICEYMNKLAISASSGLFFIGLCYWLCKNNRIEDWMCRTFMTDMGKYTLGIYIIQSIILETVMAEYIKVDSYGGIFSNLRFDIFILFPLVSFILMIIFTYMTKRIQVYKNLSFWLLGKSKN